MLVDLERGAVGQAEVADRIEQLRRRGVKVAVLSNSWGSHPFDPAQQLGMDTIHATDPTTTITKLAQMFPSATA